jgi:predicted RNA-binding Zn-ribbon protein involved in translation (DUF1610 family)
MFIRERAGIAAFDALVEQGCKENVLARVARLEQRYRLKCPECGKPFWAKPELIGRNPLTHRVTGYHCPESGCRGVVPIRDRS